MFTLLKKDKNVSLFVEPKVPRLPRLIGLPEADIELIYELWDELVDLAQGYLYVSAQLQTCRQDSIG